MCGTLIGHCIQLHNTVKGPKATVKDRSYSNRPAYKRTSIVYKRRCVFVATTNRDDWAVDETGNRRYLPIKTQNIDVAGLKRDGRLICGRS